MRPIRTATMRTLSSRVCSRCLLSHVERVSDVVCFLEPRVSPTIEDGLGVAEDADPSLDKGSTYVLPLASVLVSASVGLLTFLSSTAGSANAVNFIALCSSGMCVDTVPGFPMARRRRERGVPPVLGWNAVHVHQV